MTRRGLPHSETPGSKLVCSSPRLIAAYCVLHRLSAPRHSPYALSSLTIGIWKLRTSCVRTSKFLFPNPHLNTACSCGSEKLPFAGYSVVKDHSEGLRPSDSPTGSLAGTPYAPLRSPGARQMARLKLSADQSLPSRSSPRLWTPRAKAGGEYRARTGDLLVANQALSQLS
jgi:hypothetical protein